MALMGNRSVAGLAKQTVSDLIRLVKLEMRLAGERVKDQLAKKGKFAAVGAVGAVLLLFALLFLLATAAAALAIVWPLWLALLVVGLVLLLVGGTLAAVAARKLRSPDLVPADAKDKIKEDVQWLQNQTA